MICLRVVWPDYPPLLVSSGPWPLTCSKTLGGQNSETDALAFILTKFLFNKEIVVVLLALSLTLIGDTNLCIPF